MPNTETWWSGRRADWSLRGFVPGEMIGIYLPNCWEFGVAFHAATMAGAIPTTMNPTYREREVHYQMESSEAVALISDGPLLEGISLAGLPCSAECLHDSLCWIRRHHGLQQFVLVKLECEHAGTGARFAIDHRDASLLQRHHGTAEGGDAVAPQHRRQCLPDTDMRAKRDASATTMSSCVFCPCITSTDSRSGSICR